ncbi:hypothetical protein Q7P37_003381 [Cladosporium fusiforme]
MVIMADFLTFSRRAVTSSLRNTTALSKPNTARPFSLATSRQANNYKPKTDKFPDSQHTTRKDDRLDVQSDNSAKGQEGKANDVGGQATREKDEAGAKSKAKQEFPESPVQIGFEDERGGKGV